MRREDSSGDWMEVAPVSVIGDGYCVPYSMELIVKKKIKRFSNAQFDVFDQTGNLLLQVDGGVWNLSTKRILRHPAGFPIITMRGKALTLQHRWRAYEGKTTGREDGILFSVKQSHRIQLKKFLDVFLGNGFGMNVPDFHVIGSYTSLSFQVFQGDRLIAQATHNFTLESFCKGKETYRVKVYPEVDYAFITALLVILDENDTP